MKKDIFLVILLEHRNDTFFDTPTPISDTLRWNTSLDVTIRLSLFGGSPFPSVLTEPILVVGEADRKSVLTNVSEIVGFIPDRQTFTDE